MAAPASENAVTFSEVMSENSAWWSALSGSATACAPSATRWPITAPAAVTVSLTVRAVAANPALVSFKARASVSIAAPGTALAMVLLTPRHLDPIGAGSLAGASNNTTHAAAGSRFSHGAGPPAEASPDRGGLQGSAPLRACRPARASCRVRGHDQISPSFRDRPRPTPALDHRDFGARRSRDPGRLAPDGDPSHRPGTDRGRGRTDPAAPDFGNLAGTITRTIPGAIGAARCVGSSRGGSGRCTICTRTAAADRGRGRRAAGP